MTEDTKIRMFGAQWCGDCRRTKAQLDALELDYDYIDLEHDVAAAKVAEEISGRKQIPVVVYPDGSHQVEPSNADVEAKLRELGATS
ncbi:NrdH-redoxin [Nesterenkonia sp. LB17]|uniref:glutaredoxin domain-containing protein n=1 Tax=unclassified Nesterenkonia TaxID=2629769 RepID=UPI001F4CE031|nr:MULTISPECIES: glutaredoxin domain-containing protein [unclassified Nesterenkonia]MCH8561857.1 NrdH-redoxin [Nesterenkonia sp. YGD6]MCH8564608.1 NrdH-redoxin [Nesterenkonia sp. LB17]MCH8570232.1 NrdH-redoxin [Nesterenkonia sp. AY15]